MKMFQVKPEYDTIRKYCHEISKQTIKKSKQLLLLLLLFTNLKGANAFRCLRFDSKISGTNRKPIYTNLKHKRILMTSCHMTIDLTLGSLEIYYIDSLI